jgi:hypothetical protein
LRRYCISNIFGDADYVAELEDVSPIVARFLILSYEVIMKVRPEWRTGEKRREQKKDREERRTETKNLVVNTVVWSKTEVS